MQPSPRDPIDAGTTVESTLSRAPGAATVFLRHRMACVGCAMSPFDTLRDASRVYGIPVETLIAEIAALDLLEPPPANPETPS